MNVDFDDEGKEEYMKGRDQGNVRRVELSTDININKQQLRGNMGEGFIGTFCSYVFSFMAICKRNGFKAIFVRFRWVGLLVPVWIAGKETSTPKASLEVFVMTSERKREGGSYHKSHGLWRTKELGD